MTKENDLVKEVKYAKLYRPTKAFWKEWKEYSQGLTMKGYYPKKIRGHWYVIFVG